jgi:hypothetical protein
MWYRAKCSHSRSSRRQPSVSAWAAALWHFRGLITDNREREQRRANPVVGSGHRRPVQHQKQGQRQTELLVLLTSTVIDCPARAVAEELRRRLSGIAAPGVAR